MLIETLEMGGRDFSITMTLGVQGSISQRVRTSPNLGLGDIQIAWLVPS